MKTSRDTSKHNQAKDIAQIGANIKSRYGIDTEFVVHERFLSCLNDLREFARKTTQQRAMFQVFWYWVPLALYAGAIFSLSSQSYPEDQLPSFLVKEVSDKVLHAVEYGILALLCYRAFRWAAGPVVARQAVVLAIMTASVFGVTDEVHQVFVPFRESNWPDWLADTIGAVIGAVSWRSIMSK